MGFYTKNTISANITKSFGFAKGRLKHDFSLFRWVLWRFIVTAGSSKATVELYPL